MVGGKGVKGKYHSWDIPGTLLGAFTFTTSFNVHNKNVTVPPSVQKDSEFLQQHSEMNGYLIQTA